MHVHDASWPFEYPDTRFVERHDRDDASVLQAFSGEGDRRRIELFDDHLRQGRPHLLPPAICGIGTGSIRLRRGG